MVADMNRLVAFVGLWKWVCSSPSSACGSALTQQSTPPDSPAIWTRPPLCSHSRGDCCLGAYIIIPQAVAAVHRVRYINLHQEHEVLIPLLDVPNCLGKSEPTNVPNVVRNQVEYHGARHPALRQQRRWVQMVTTIPYCSGEAYDNILHPASDSTRIPCENAPYSLPYLH